MLYLTTLQIWIQDNWILEPCELSTNSGLMIKCPYHLNTVGIWNLTFQNQETFEIQIFEGRISNGWALAMAIALVPTIWNRDIFVRILRVFSKMAAICQDLKWFSFQISDTIWNLDHLQPNLFSTIWNPYLSGFQTLTVPD